MTRTCARCNKEKKIIARGLCNACYIKSNNDKTIKKYKRVRESYKNKKKCKKCKKMKFLYSARLCHSCYNSEKTLKTTLSGKEIRIILPINCKNDAREFFQKRKDELLKEIQDNPRKWLDKTQ